MSGTPFPRSPVLPFYLGLILASTPAVGQESFVSPGERIRVKHACEGEAKPAPCRTEVGKVTAVLGDTIVLDDHGNGERRLVLGPKAKVELSAGRHGHAMAGFGIGTLAGLVLGVGIDQGCRASTIDDNDGYCPLVYFLTVPAGLLIGTVAGALTKSERWHEVKKPTARLQILPGVTPSGVAVSASLRF